MGNSNGTVSTMISSPWHRAISDYIEYLQAGGAPASTIATRRQHLYFLARHLGGSPWTINPKRLVKVFGDLVCAQETRRSRRTTLRAFYRWAVDAGETATNLALSLPVVKATRPNPRPVPDRVYAQTMADATPREILMIRLASEAGLRRTEVATGHSDNLLEDLDGWTLRVVGKGDKVREIPLPDDLALQLLALPAGWFFPGRDNGHLSPRWVGTLLSRLMPGVWTMHKLRHRAATRWYEVDRDVFVVQRLLGHASPATTQAYVAVKDDRLRRTVVAAA